MDKSKYLKYSIISSALISIIIPFVGILIGLFLGALFQLEEEVIGTLLGMPIILEVFLLDESYTWFILRFVIFITFGVINYYIYEKIFRRLNRPWTYFIISSIIFYYIAVFFIYSYISHFLFGGPYFPVI